MRVLYLVGLAVGCCIAATPAAFAADPEAQHRRHPGRRPRQRGSRLSRERHPDAEHRQAREGGRAARILPRRAGLHPRPRGVDDGPLSDALRPADAGDLPEPFATACRPTNAPCRRRSKQAGYQTAMVGKWHLGHADTKYWPQNRGFEHFYGNTVGEVDYFTHQRSGVTDWQRDGRVHLREGLRHHVDRRRSGASDREAGRDEARSSCTSRRSRRTRPTRRRRPTKTATQPRSRTRRAAPMRR